MSDKQWDDIGKLFADLQRRTPGERAERLARIRAENPDLARELDSLLAADDSAGAFLHTMSPGDASALLEDNGQTPEEISQVGNYRITKELGSGGMGVVYLAERADGQFDQKVALKLIKRGMDSNVILRRFLLERQILARLQHPCIAGLLDGGVSESGQPFFAMEYVDGVPLIDFCNREKMNLRQRLGLFRKVCQAIRHAHQQLIVHRDLKPSNILVGSNGQPKLLDFGIAKLLDTNEEGSSGMLTASGIRLLTPEYGAPEQMRGEPVTTATDIYALGMILYELLSGQRPYDFEQRTSEEMARVIQETDPTRPSTAATRGVDVERAAAVRGLSVPKLQRLLRGDLDTIILKTLQKAPDRRYATVDALLEDIDCYLQGLPVRARPDTLLYRTRKFVRRHTGGVITAAAGVLLLLAFAVTMTVQAGRIAAERDRANQEAEAKGLVSEFLKDLFTVSDPSEARGNSITARELLDKGAEKIEGMLAEQPETRADLMATMGSVYRRLGLLPQAEPLIAEALETQKRVLGGDHPDTLVSMNSLASLYNVLGRYDEAESLHLETLETLKRVHGEDHPRTLVSMNNLANLYANQGRINEAELLYVEIFEVRKRVLGDDHPKTLLSMSNLAILYDEQGRSDEAEPLYLESLKTKKRVLGDDHPSTLASMNNLANLYIAQGRYADAEPLLVETLGTHKRVLGDDHINTLITVHNLACLYRDTGRFAEAQQGFERVQRFCDDKLAAKHSFALANMDEHAKLLRKTGDDAGAERLEARAKTIRGK